MDRPSPCIGLFGTCGNSQWRAPFIKRYEQEGYAFFNPQVDDWRPELALEEADHLVNDEVILFPVTNETDGIGSLSESGFSILQALKNPNGRDFVIMIHDHVDTDKVTDPAVAKASVRARALVLAHLKKIEMPNVFIVPTLTHVLELSDELYRMRKQQMRLDARRAELRHYTT